MSMMGYRSRLTSSVIWLSLFYNAAGALAFYAMGPNTLQEWLTQRGLWDQAKDGQITPLNAASVATNITVDHGLTALAWGGAGIGAAIVTMLVVTLTLKLLHRLRARAQGR